MKNIIITLLMIVAVQTSAILAQTTAFTYQGSLKDGANPANGNYDFEFKLFDAASGGAQQGSTLQRLSVAVANGIFTVSLDFGAGTLPGGDRFLDISVRTAGGGAFTPFTPRQRVNSAPYSVRSLNSTTADVATNATQLGGVDANQYVLTGDPRMSDARAASSIDFGTAVLTGVVPVTNGGTGSPTQNFVDLSTNQTIAGNKTFTGDLSAKSINSGTLFSIGGQRILSAPATGNLFAGVSSGEANSSGNNNSFFGTQAGSHNISGSNNAFFGRRSGTDSIAGSNNTMIGAGTGVTAGDISFATAIGAGATASANNTVVLGRDVDTVQIPGSLNVTGALNANGSNLTNLNAGSITSGILPIANGGTGLSSSGSQGNFLRSNGSVWTSTTIGPFDLPPGSPSYIHNSTISQNANFNILGNGTLNNLTATSGSVFGNWSVGGNVNAARYDLSGFPILKFAPGTTSSIIVGRDSGVNTTGASNAFFGANAGENTTTGSANSFFGATAGRFSNGTANSFFGIGSGAGTSGSNNSFFGNGAGSVNTLGNNNTLLGSGANVSSGDLTFATAIGAGSTVATSNTIMLGRNNGGDTVRVTGPLHINLAAGGIISVCTTGIGVLASCSSSIRYKNNVRAFTFGLELVRRLRPVSFDWKQDDISDMGLVAEEVAAVEPLLVTYNAKGEVEGVKYDRIGVVLINAVKEQQAEIEFQQKEIADQKAINQKLQSQVDTQQKQIEALKKFICSASPDSAFCKE